MCIIGYAGTEDITSAAPMFSSDIAPRVPDRLQRPDASLAAATPEEFSAHRQHSLLQVGTLTATFDLKAYMIKNKVNDITYYFCGYPDCGHKGRFDGRRQVISHIRCIHLKEKPFKCMTCGTFFARKQDATRHVNTMNRGKIFECTVCHKCYAREDFRDKHAKRCGTKSQGKEQKRS
ncbi:hypothetical protein JB92DRAFT_365642 [Gautieria morchelliformis]|nr:hypothetical protein JB92DRAFT_365642 [Gautieria morchelliformis]